MYKLKNLTKKYHQKTVLSEVEFDFPEKGLVCLMGESGTGKSSLLHILAGLDCEYQGAVLFAGQNLGQLTQEESRNFRKDYLGLVFQDYHLLEGYTALENVLYPSCLQAEADKDSLANKGKGLLEAVGLATQQNQKSEQLSGGQKQRVAIARALLNNPQVILADEPTGALDREAATEIMGLLKEIAKERLVVVITHDPLICADADQVLTIEDGKILVTQGTTVRGQTTGSPFQLKSANRVATNKLAWKNFKVNLKNYGLMAVIFAISGTCLLFTLAANQVVKTGISDFQQKNSALSNGFIKAGAESSDKVYEKLSKDQRLENVYKQYLLKDVKLKIADKTITLGEKYPLPRAKEVMSYGRMPSKGLQEIALSGTLAKQFAPEINQLIGKNLKATVNQKTYNLKVSGIYNAGYDDMYVSSDVEQGFYQKRAKEPWQGITFDVKNFEEIVPVYESLVASEVTPEMGVTEVKTMLASFTKIKSIFTIISLLVLGVCLFLIVLLLQKLQGTRLKLIGLLGAFGFKRQTISRLLAGENVLLASLATLLTAVFSGSVAFIAQGVGWTVPLSLRDLVLLMVGTFVSVVLLSLTLQQKALSVSIIESLK